MPDVPAAPIRARPLTEAAARACGSWIGHENKDAADAAAVDALQEAATAASLNGTVVIGEGEKDDAPYLAPGTNLGPDPEAPLDIAVDPLEGTTLVANDAPGALSVLALAPAGSIQPLGRAFYAEKLIGPPAAADALTLDASPKQGVTAVAEALDVPIGEVRVAVQERPRHEDLVAALRDAGAQVHLFGEGDLSFALLALQARPDARIRPTGNAAPDAAGPPVDLLWGIGGAPEGILAAAAQRVVGGTVRFRLAPRSDAERTRLRNDPALPDDVLTRPFTAADLVASDTVTVTLTGITDGPLLRGLRSRPDGMETETLILSPDQPPQRKRSYSPSTADR